MPEGLEKKIGIAVGLIIIEKAAQDLVHNAF